MQTNSEPNRKLKFVNHNSQNSLNITCFHVFIKFCEKHLLNVVLKNIFSRLFKKIRKITCFSKFSLTTFCKNNRSSYNYVKITVSQTLHRENINCWSHFSCLWVSGANQAKPCHYLVKCKVTFLSVYKIICCQSLFQVSVKYFLNKR